MLSCAIIVFQSTQLYVSSMCFDDVMMQIYIVFFNEPSEIEENKHQKVTNHKFWVILQWLRHEFSSGTNNFLKQEQVSVMVLNLSGWLTRAKKLWKCWKGIKICIYHRMTTKMIAGKIGMAKKGTSQICVRMLQQDNALTDTAVLVRQLLIQNSISLMNIFVLLSDWVQVLFPKLCSNGCNLGHEVQQHSSCKLKVISGDAFQDCFEVWQKGIASCVAAKWVNSN